MNPNRTARQTLIIALVAGFALPAAAFTADQAAAGRATFEQNCAACHGPTLRQLPSAILAGPEFVSKWGERTPASASHSAVVRSLHFDTNSGPARIALGN